MKYSLLIIFLSLGISHGFFGSIGQSINNIGGSIQTSVDQIGKEVDKTIESGTNQVGEGIDNAIKDVKGEVENVVGQLLNIANGIQFAANFLWDAVLSPTFDMIIQGGQLFLDDKLGAIVNTVTRPPTLSENPLTDKYAQLVARLKSNIHHLYEQLFLMEQDALKAIQDGEVSFEERIRDFHEKINAIQKQLDKWAAEIKSELEVYAITLVRDLKNILNQYKQNIDTSIQSIVKLFRQLTENLMKNFLQFVQNVIPNAGNTIENLKEQGLLSFI